MSIVAVDFGLALVVIQWDTSVAIVVHVLVLIVLIIICGQIGLVNPLISS